MSKYPGILLLILFCNIAIAQPGWNWPEEPEKRDMALEKQAYYKVLMQTDKPLEAFNTISWLWKNTPDLNESIYQDGSKIIDDLLEQKLAADRKLRLEDSLLWTYDMRIKYFGHKAKVLDRKAYTAFKLYYKNPDKFSLVRELYQELFSLEPTQVSDFNLTPYMTLATYYYKSKPDEFKPTDVLDVHARITEVIDLKIAAGENYEKLQKEQDKVDAFLNSLGDGLISCDFIATQLVPKFELDSTNLNLAKKIFSYSLTAKCTDQPYFLSAGETLFFKEPTYSLAKALADKHYFLKNYNQAKFFYEELLKLSIDKDQKFEALMGQASTEAKTGNKVKARALAREALSNKPGASEAYNLIGNLYFLSYDECRQGESRVDDRSIFIAAYEMYKKAGNSQQMAAAKEQFPSIEEIFTENKEEGQKVTVGCWVNETVTLQRR